MAIQDVVVQLVNMVAKNPQILSGLMEHPYSTIGNMTDNNNVSKEEASQVVAATAAMASGREVDFGGLDKLAAGLLSDNGGSVHAMANALLGSGSTQGVDVSQGIDMGMISTLMGVAGSLFGGIGAQPAATAASGRTAAVAGAAKPAVDLSDGIGLDDVLGIAGSLLGGDAQK